MRRTLDKDAGVVALLQGPPWLDLPGALPQREVRRLAHWLEPVRRAARIRGTGGDQVREPIERGGGDRVEVELAEDVVQTQVRLDVVGVVVVADRGERARAAKLVG